MRIDCSSRPTAATGAAAPSSAQLSPPKAIALTPIAACSATIAAARSRRPSVAWAPSDQNAATLATVTMSRHTATDRSRSRVAWYCRS